MIRRLRKQKAFSSMALFLNDTFPSVVNTNLKYSAWLTQIYTVSVILRPRFRCRTQYIFAIDRT